MTIGVLMLDTTFERFVGDIGNPKSFARPALFERIEGATVERIVTARTAQLIEPFIAAGHRLIARGAKALTTSCGFLVLNQGTLAASLPVPVGTSALLLLPLIARLTPPSKRVGVLTFSGRDLTPAHFAAAAAPIDTPFVGVADDGVFRRALLGKPVEDSFSAREADVVAAARTLLSEHRDIGSILFECTNFPPHRAAVARETGLPIYDIWTLIGMLESAVTMPAPASR